MSIQYSNMTLPGTSSNVYANIDVGRSDYVAEALGQAGNVMMSLGEDLYKLQAQTELTDAIMADQQALNTLSQYYQSNPDEHTYQQAYDKTYNEISSRKIKNGLARRLHTEWVKQQTPSWQNALRETVSARVKDNAIAS